MLFSISLVGRNAVEWCGKERSDVNGDEEAEEIDDFLIGV